MSQSRDKNLDLLRAAAILAVLVYHIEGMWPIRYPAVSQFASLGKYGVTLFFVLSGWLIGGIYWRERRATGGVKMGSFWVRRWLRTLPPYYAGMLLAFAAVYVSRRESFDPRYLVFLQNYERVIPFYLISWSLCVEEHFYLALPPFGRLISRMRPGGLLILLWTIPLLSPILRWIDPLAVFPAPYGYTYTATHLVSEGLAMGVAAAFSQRYFPALWSTLQRGARLAAVPAIAVVLWTAWWSESAMHYTGQSVIAVCCLVWLAAVAGQRTLCDSISPAVYVISISSYSTYLVHSLAIHLGLRIATWTSSVPAQLFSLLCWIGIIAAFSGAFYFVVERSAIRFRDYLTRH